MTADILARIEAAHEQIERVHVRVDEWGADLWFNKEITLSRRKTISAGLDPKDEAGITVSYLLHEAQNEDGSKVFKADAKTRATLEGKASAKVIMRIMQEIGGAETVDEAKNA